MPTAYTSLPSTASASRNTGGDGIEFWGGTFLADPFGVVIASARSSGEEVIIGRVDPARIEEVRRGWPFLRDRRVDAYPESRSGSSRKNERSRHAMPGGMGAPFRDLDRLAAQSRPTGPGSFPRSPWCTPRSSGRSFPARRSGSSWTPPADEAKVRRILSTGGAAPDVQFSSHPHQPHLGP